ncbi:DUF423 domain-containing protein [Luteimonas sp. RD2P54]|uniref:DUF423 domain-containing protein n=1 Tax=Luteimonas endophytica TaxID=3042023 RepID=A0ABT6JB98_9GAMM|nr:DUF423 domain-containing protein [Luteimonas endophytica]MDH5824096.1 DUF423 domain-containing protein [Luteimonas endophytica]
MSRVHAASRSPLAAAGAAAAAMAVGLSAWAAHGLEGADQVRMQTAALYAFGHGVALAALAPRRRGRAGSAALALLLAGVSLFCGSLAGAVLFRWPTPAAPLGGMLMIAGWLLLAADFLRQRSPG